MSTAAWSRWRRILCSCILAAAALETVFFFFSELHLLRIPFQRDYGEGHVLWMTQRIFDFTQAYKTVDSMPYVAFLYPPLYMAATRFVNLFLSDLLLSGRALSLVSTAGIASVVALIVGISWSSRAPSLWRGTAAAFAGALVFLMDSVVGWSSLMRVDMLALFLMYLGLLIYMVLGTRERWQYLAATLFILAIFTKQTMLSAPIACLIVGFATHWKATARVCVFSASLITVITLSLDAATQGGFLTSILDYNVNPFYWASAQERTYQHLVGTLPWVVLAAAALLRFLFRARLRLRFRGRWTGTWSSNSYERTIVLCALNTVFAGFATLAIGKMAAAYNHFLSWDISLCLMCGLFLFRLLATWDKSRPSDMRAGIYTALLLGSLAFASTAMISQPGDSEQGDDPSYDHEVIPVIQRAIGPVFSENLLMLIQAGKPVDVEPCSVTLLALIDRWNERSYAKLFETQYFSLLVTYDIHFPERYSSRITSAIENNYVRERGIGPYTLYRPRLETRR